MLESLGRLRGVRLAASGLLATAAIGWVLLGPGVAGLTPSGPPADEGATTGKARSEPASSVVPSTEGGHRCEHERGGGARTGYARDGGEGRATARSRSLAGSLYRFARAPAAGERVRWARDVALTAPTARLVVRRDQTTTREAWTTEAGPAGDYLLADLAASQGRYRVDDVRHVDCRSRVRASTGSAETAWISVQARGSVRCSAWWAVDVFLDDQERVTRLRVTTP